MYVCICMTSDQIISLGIKIIWLGMGCDLILWLGHMKSCHVDKYRWYLFPCNKSTPGIVFSLFFSPSFELPYADNIGRSAGSTGCPCNPRATSEPSFLAAFENPEAKDRMQYQRQYMYLPPPCCWHPLSMTPVSLCSPVLYPNPALSLPPPPPVDDAFALSTTEGGR